MSIVAYGSGMPQFIIHDAPAWVCEQCGEPLSEKTVNVIQEALQGVDTRLEKSALSFAAP
ncbi:MAG: YgiT-type zinc finger protein [Anaerolineae bacterium]|nr:YgiT-type zinc finger protein [Anaerolineae bacterium]